MFAKQGGTFERSAAHVDFAEIQPGLYLQAVDLRPQRRQSASVLIPPSLGIAVLLRGRTDLRCGSRRFQFHTNSESCPMPQVSLFRVARTIEILRSVDANVRLRHLSLQATPDWVERSGIAADVDVMPHFEDASHAAVCRASGRVVAICEQLLRDGESQTALARLRRESQALDVVGQVLTILGCQGHRAVLSTRQLHRLQQVREQLESESEAPTVEQLARTAAMSVDTLQRQFRAVFGTTVFGYLQEHRLQRSYRELEAGSPVSSAAYAAGYSSPANFATAFKRRFGISPKQVRHRL